ncbi:apoptosis facilitator Bcl-2-like protein 14 [Sphaerodactylus townsendi]|uniref:apoptosis facilitator Bcl-2-like protein 14 n=1 Tax=Sphaerodactylus townsendi TaxID=933632 RepID=UPI002025C6DD|nr:apoptosis facilitator Bcl-2-like protein 14 [Sphaerodactylus townsendi]XP_048371409.1 apoptosis facilitator Bcl-2-like protein 14 [Sphaerodactylus townsendi]
MSSANFSSMEEISLDDVDKSSMEYKMLMVYVQRRLPASKYGQLLEREAKGQEGSSPIRLEGPEATPVERGKAPQDLPPGDSKCPSRKKSQKKKRRSNLKRLFLPSCLRGQPGEDPRKSEVNGKQPPPFRGQGDSGITRVADKLAELVDHSRFNAGGIEFRGLDRTVSLEEDGRTASKMACQGPEDDGKDHEEKIIDTIVALLRKSGDELEAQMQKDKTFCSSFWDLMSYSFFRRIANQFLKEIPVDPVRDSEDHVQSTRAAYVMEVTTRLTAVDNHPMNLVLGFGTKYLRENFKPWVCSHGGWEKALGLLDQDEVE